MAWTMNFRSSDPAVKLRKLRLTFFNGLFEFATGFAHYALSIVSMSLLLFSILLLISLAAICAAGSGDRMTSFLTSGRDFRFRRTETNCCQTEIVNGIILQNPLRILLCIAMAMWFGERQTTRIGHFGCSHDQHLMENFLRRTFVCCRGCLQF